MSNFDPYLTVFIAKAAKNHTTRSASRAFQWHNSPVPEIPVIQLLQVQN